MAKPNNHVIWILLLLIASIFQSCNSNKQESSKDFYITLLIRNPQGCTHSITLDESGKGQLKAGGESNYYTDFSALEEIYKEQSFSLQDEDWKRVLKMINELNNQKLQKTNRPKDAVHNELFINGTKKIDAYARKSEAVNTLKEVIQNALSFEMDYFCETYVQP